MSNDIKLLIDIKDIRDELHTMQVIFNDQKEVLQNLWNLLPIEKLTDIVDGNIKAVKDMEDHAEETCDAVRV